MSSTMWAWRVVIPGMGLVCCLSVFYYTSRGESLPAGWTSAAPSPLRTTKPPTLKRVIAEGRVVARPGAEVTVGSEAGGTVLALPAREKMRVKRGDLLLEFGSDDQKAALAEAEARLVEIDAEVGFHRREYARRTNSAAKSDQFQAEIDSTRRDYEVAAARRKAAVAVLDRCRSALARTRVVSPIDGVILDCSIQVGEVAPPSSRLITVCDLSRVWVEAEVDEFDADKVAQGDPALIVVQGHGETSWKGVIEEVPDRVAERNLRPEDPGRPSDTHVLMVKIAIEAGPPLKLGQKVEVEIRPR